MKPKAYSYIRMSTDIQLRGDSLRRQTEASRKYADEHGLELIEDFKLEDIGVSAFHGRNANQGALGRFLTLCEEGSIKPGSYLIVESLDRISRQNPRSATTLFLQILEAGIDIVTLTDRHVYRADNADFMDIIVSVLIMSRAHEESRTKSLRVGAAWENKRQNIPIKKLTRVAPVWLTLSEDRTYFELVPERVAVVRSMFDEADLGKGSLQISRRLNSEGVPTFAPSKGWYESYVSKVLTSRAVIGEFQPHRYIDGKRVPHGDPIQDYFPAVVAREQFERIQIGRAVRRVRGAGRKGINNVNLFQGVAQCGYCDGRMMVVNKGQGPKGGVYFRCDRARRGADCNASSWPLEHFEAAFLWFVDELDIRAIAEGADAEAMRKEAEGRIAVVLADIDKEKRVRESAFELIGENLSVAAYVKDKIGQSTLKIDALEKELRDLRMRTNSAGSSTSRSLDEMKEIIQNFGKWHTADSDARIKVANWVKHNIKELLVYSDGLDEPTTGGPRPRQLSVSLISGEFRTVQISGSDPTVAAYSVYANDDVWKITEGRVCKST
ncbi:recombinase family protein [Rhizobium ruizarguesonis]|uniref:recombinase family protein n=1 Tax=Rhizobium ruizarguesonis TaxID=2081791 RepID=UPI0010307BE5|nr:recombinase family protein [Rhizobium ruizarguesonis]TAY81974.1 recombinase family protein [Rhizobium ruizarguesonis]